MSSSRPGDVPVVDLVVELAPVHVEEVAEDHRRPRIADRAGEHAIVVGLLPGLAEEAVELRGAEAPGRDGLAQPVEHLQAGALVGLDEADVERDDARPIRREPVDERRELRARPRPSALDVEALLVDHREDHGPRRRPRATRPDAQVVGPELDLVEDRHAPQRERHDHEDGRDGQRERGGQQRSQRPLHECSGVVLHGRPRRFQKRLWTSPICV
jgi:hypothetical protein